VETQVTRAAGTRPGAQPGAGSLPPRYRPLERLAAGGMGSIWLAEDDLLRRQVVVKLLADNVAEDPQLVERFEREARTAASLSGHPNVVTIFDVGQHQGRPYIVMEYLPGGTLAERLGPGGRISPRQWISWLRQAASGLDFAHEHGVVHRDVKPGNLLFDERGRLVIADFGIARTAYEQPLTRSGELLGTAAYISPEQARGEGGSAASDRYSLALIAYELLTGERPFGGGGFVEQARRHLEEEPEPPSRRTASLSPLVDPVVMRGLAKEPEQRWPSAGEFVTALAGAIGEREPSAEAEPAPAAKPVPAAEARPAADATPAARRPAPRPSPLLTDRASRSDLVRWLPVAAIVVAAIAAGVLAASALNGGDGSPDGSRGDRSAANRPSRSTPERQGTDTTAPAPAGEQGGQAGTAGAAGLNDQGFALMKGGRYEQAIPLLQKAVAGFPAGSRDLTYAYALYNLGRSLRLAGRPAEAIPLLERRLGIPNQRETVARELAAARRAAAR
jgi:eukaryotic-like serine/threonine-protein kinase